MTKARFTQRWLEEHRVHLDPLARDQVVGIGHALAEIDSLLVRLREPERAAAIGAVPPRGILFHGVPGTGKTLLARYLASSLGPDVPLFEVGSDELSPDRLRQGVRWLSNTYGTSVLFIDEADSWAVSRAYMSHSPATRLLLTAALNALDGLVPANGPVVVIATNRHPLELDAALLRSGRLGIHIAFDLPDEDERVALFELFVNGRPTNGALDLRRAARLTRGKTPADLRAFVDDAAGLALAAGRDAIKDEDLVAAVRRAGDIVPDADAQNPARRWRTAVHEGSHVAAGAILRGPGWVHSVALDAMGGRTMFGSEDVIDSDRPDDELRDILVAGFAGAAGEVAVLGEPTLGVNGDVAHLTSLTLARLAAGFEAGHPPIDLEYFGRNVSETLKSSLGDQTGKALSRAREAARQIVEMNVDAIVRFATVLDRAGELTGVELIQAIDEAGFQAPGSNGA